jgi:flagellar protein FliL
VKNVVIYIVGGLLGVALVGGVAFGAAKFAIGNVEGGAQQVAVVDGAAPKVAVTAENTLALKPFTTNLADANRNSYINVTFELVLQSTDHMETVKAQTPVIRDAIVGILHSKTSMEVTGTEAANTLKTDVQTKVNEALGGPFVSQVLVTDIVVQP